MYLILYKQRNIKNLAIRLKKIVLFYCQAECKDKSTQYSNVHIFISVSKTTKN